MGIKFWHAVSLAVLCSVLLGALRAEDAAPTDEGKAEEFKGKTFDLKAKGKATIALTFPAGKEAAVSVRSDKETDIHLFVYDSTKKLVAKDDSPGPSCDLTFSPKEGGKYILEVVNEGPGANRSTLKVVFGKASR